MPCSCPGQIREMDKDGGRGEASIWVAWLAFSKSTCFAETCSLTLPSPRPGQAGSGRELEFRTTPEDTTLMCSVLLALSPCLK